MTSRTKIYEHAMELMRQGLPDVEVVRLTGLNMQVVAAIRRDLLHPQNPEF